MLENNELDTKNSKDIKSKLKIANEDYHTYVVIAAVHTNHLYNNFTKISCKKGIPINGYVYDTAEDCYYIDCVEYYKIGIIPVAYAVCLKECAWQVHCPLPEAVIKKYLSNEQSQELKNFKQKYGSEEYNYKFLQMIYPL